MNYPQCLANYLLGLVFPVKCIFCGLILNSNEYVCRKCFKSIPIYKKFECLGCRRYSKFSQTCFVCRKEYFIDYVFAVGDYKNEKIQNLIKFYKYRFIKDLAGPASGLIAKYLFWLSNKKGFNIFQSSPLLVPVPLSHRRLNWRGFNQSKLLAQEIGRAAQLDLDASLLLKQSSSPQADIKEKEARLANVVGKFKYIGQNLRDKDIVLVDDVCTTGATLNECAKILKQNGAGKIYALVIARG